jgi:2-oxoglutarate/2-oxoacid ferredoxin oxidoreductase subunit alpha
MKKLTLDNVVIKFAGDSGDGIQLIGNQFSDASVILSENDIYTFVDFPSEIRSPAGSLSGISGFQIALSSKKIYNVDINIDLLVAFNPAALKSSILNLKNGGILITDSDSFSDKNLKKANFDINPLTDNSLSKFKLINVPITNLTYECVKDILPVISKAKKCKNFFVLGMVCWIYDRNINNIILWIEKKFKNDFNVCLANKKAIKSGYDYCLNSDIINYQFYIPPFNIYNNNDKLVKISGNKAFCLGAISSSFLFGMPLFSANYPITPASDILHELSLYINENIKIIQMEDEIAAIGAAIGASYGGSLSFTCTSGPGIDLMQESLGLAVMTGLPLLVLDIQRCGPSTGIPTKSEQTDLLSSVFGRHGECGVIVMAPLSPSDCFWTIIEAFYLAIKSSNPIIILSDANLANSSELWSIPKENYIKSKYKLHEIKENLDKFIYNINKVSCIGGLEKSLLTDEVSHDSDNHFEMTKKRLKRLNQVKNFYLPLTILGENNGDVLIITWGSVYGPVRTIYENILSDITCKLSVLGLRYLNPFPNELDNIINNFKKFIIIEENFGHLAFILRSKYLIDTININQVTGKPFNIKYLKEKILLNL